MSNSTPPLVLAVSSKTASSTSADQSAERLMIENALESHCESSSSGVTYPPPEFVAESVAHLFPTLSRSSSPPPFAPPLHPLLFDGESTGPTPPLSPPPKKRKEKKKPTKPVAEQEYKKRAKKRESKKPSITKSVGGDSILNNSANNAHLEKLGEIDAKIEKLKEKEEEAKKANDIEAKVASQEDLSSRTWDVTVGRINDSPDFLRTFFRRQTPDGCNYTYRSDWLPTEQYSLDHITGVPPEDVGHVRNVAGGLVHLTGGMIPPVAEWIYALVFKGFMSFLYYKMKQRGMSNIFPRFPVTNGFFGRVAQIANIVLDYMSPNLWLLFNTIRLVMKLVFRTSTLNWALKQQVSDVKYEITVTDPQPEFYHDLRAVATLHNRLLRTVMPAQYTLVVKKRIPSVGIDLLLAIPRCIRAASPAPLAHFITYEEQETQTIHGTLSLELLAELCSADKARTALNVGEAMKRLDEMSSFVGSFNFNRFDLTAYSQGTVTVAQAIVKSRTLQLNSDRRSVLTDF